MLILDPCTRNVQNSGQEDTRCLARGTWKNRSALAVRPSLGHGILQLGGRASTPLRFADHGWTVEPTSRSLDGCISHLRINGQVEFKWCYYSALHMIRFFMISKGKGDEVLL